MCGVMGRKEALVSQATFCGYVCFPHPEQGPVLLVTSPMGSGSLRKKVKVKSLSRVQLFATPWNVAYQASPSMKFSRQECWSGLPFPSPGDLPNPKIEPRSPALQADALPSEPPGKSRPYIILIFKASGLSGNYIQGIVLPIPSSNLPPPPTIQCLLIIRVCCCCC